MSSITFVFVQSHFKYAHIEINAHTHRPMITLHQITLDHRIETNKYAAATFAQIDIIVLITNGFIVPEALNIAPESNKNHINTYPNATTMR